MGQDSKIEWTHHTFNPWMGCTKVSPGCAHCYAEALMDHRYGKVQWGKGNPRQRTSEANWNLPLRWNREAGRALNARTTIDRPRVFCASLADWLDMEVVHEWRVDLLNLIEATPNLDWLLLTKRPESWSARMHEAAYASPLAARWIGGRAPANVWVGTSVEDQTRADERIPQLLRIPARVRFLSCEPLLGPLNLSKDETVQWCNACGEITPTSELSGGTDFKCGACGDPRTRERSFLDCIQWVICGGESGPGSRPMPEEWARDIRDQCKASEVAYFFKQWGGVNKKESGRLLDNQTWDQLPATLPA